MVLERFALSRLSPMTRFLERLRRLSPSTGITVNDLRTGAQTLPSYVPANERMRVQQKLRPKHDFVLAPGSRLGHSSRPVSRSSSGVKHQPSVRAWTRACVGRVLFWRKPRTRILFGKSLVQFLFSMEISFDAKQQGFHRCAASGGSCLPDSPKNNEDPGLQERNDINCTRPRHLQKIASLKSNEEGFIASSCFCFFPSECL